MMKRQTNFTISHLKHLLEIGSYCGKSAYIIGCACKQHDSILFSIDHHKGSQEQQSGEEYFDSDLFDSKLSRVNTFPFFQQTISRTSLGEDVEDTFGNVIYRWWALL